MLRNDRKKRYVFESLENRRLMASDLLAAGANLAGIGMSLGTSGHGAAAMVSTPVAAAGLSTSLTSEPAASAAASAHVSTAVSARLNVSTPAASATAASKVSTAVRLDSQPILSGVESLTGPVDGNVLAAAISQMLDDPVDSLNLPSISAIISATNNSLVSANESLAGSVERVAVNAGNLNLDSVPGPNGFNSVVTNLQSATGSANSVITTINSNRPAALASSTSQSVNAAAAAVGSELKSAASEVSNTTTAAGMAAASQLLASDFSIIASEIQHNNVPQTAGGVITQSQHITLPVL